MCLAQGHNTVTPVRLRPTTPWYQVKHSTIGPLRSHCNFGDIVVNILSDLLQNGI